MILKKTITASGTQVQDAAAALNAGLKDYLTGTGLFRLVSVEAGYGDWPKYTLKYQGTEYYLTLQSSSNSYSSDRNIVVGIFRSTLDETAYERSISYGNISNAQISVHLIENGGSFAFKVFNAAGTVALGGSCLRYMKFSGERGYLYHSLETTSLLGYMGRYEAEPGAICQISYLEYPYTEYAVMQEMPILKYDGVAIGYAEDIVTISVPQPSDSHAFSLYQLQGLDYHGGRLAYNQFVSSSISSCTAIAMKSS